MARSHALGRLGVPDDIASGALFLDLRRVVVDDRRAARRRRRRRRRLPLTPPMGSVSRCRRRWGRRSECRCGGGARARRRPRDSSRPRSRRRCPSPAAAPRPAMPATSIPAGIVVPAATTEPAATSARAPIVAPSSTTLPFATRHSASSIAPCTTQLCPTVTPVADVGREPGTTVDHRVVLHVGAGAHDHRRVVGADHRAVPDRRAVLDDHVADQRRGRRDERAPGAPAASGPRTRTAASPVTPYRNARATASRGPSGVTIDDEVGIGNRSADARTPGSIRRPTR